MARAETVRHARFSAYSVTSHQHEALSVLGDGTDMSVEHIYWSLEFSLSVELGFVEDMGIKAEGAFDKLIHGKTSV